MRRTKTAVIWVIGVLFGTLIDIVLPEIIKTAIYGYVTERLVQFVGLWWASMIAFVITNAIPIIAGLGLIAFTFWLRISEPEEGHRQVG